MFDVIGTVSMECLNAAFLRPTYILHGLTFTYVPHVAGKSYQTEEKRARTSIVCTQH